MSMKKKGHLLLTKTTTDSVAHFIWPKASGTLSSDTHGSGFGWSNNPSTSPFNDGTKSATIYSITAQGASAGVKLNLEDKDGSFLMEISAATGWIATTLDFGEEGIRLPLGFRLSIPGSLGFVVTVAYEVD